MSLRLITLAIVTTSLLGAACARQPASSDTSPSEAAVAIETKDESDEVPPARLGTEDGLLKVSVDESELVPGAPFTLSINNPKELLCTDSWLDLDRQEPNGWEPVYRLVLPYGGSERGGYLPVDEEWGQHDVLLCPDGPVPMTLPPLETGTYRLNSVYGDVTFTIPVG